MSADRARAAAWLLIPACAGLLSACTIQATERFSMQTVDGRKFTLVCPVRKVEGGPQLLAHYCKVDMTEGKK